MVDYCAADQCADQFVAIVVATCITMSVVMPIATLTVVMAIAVVVSGVTEPLWAR